MNESAGIPRRRILWELWPALAVLLVTILIATFVREFAFASGPHAPAVILGRFFRLFLNFSVPILLLPVLCALMQKILNWHPRQLVRLGRPEQGGFYPLQNWVLRPLQGIGLMMFVAGRFFSLLRQVEGSAVAAAPTSPGAFTWERAINLGITALLLSFLWTMDDLSLRHYNRKTGEIRRLGKYLISILPVVSGFYGAYRYFQQQTPLTAVLLIVQLIIIFYPPLVAFNILHTHFVDRFRPLLLKKLRVVFNIHLHTLTRRD
jgi:hypothetical protein